MGKVLALLTASVAAAVVIAPISAADEHLECSNPSGNNTICQTPGNAQITPSQDANTSFPGYGWPYQYGPVIVWGGLFGNNGGSGRTGGGGGR